MKHWGGILLGAWSVLVLYDMVRYWYNPKINLRASYFPHPLSSTLQSNERHITTAVLFLERYVSVRAYAIFSLE